jgi:hypothetical protein
VKADAPVPDAMRIDVGLKDVRAVHRLEETAIDEALKVGMEMALADQMVRRHHAAKLTAEIVPKAGTQIGRAGQKVHREVQHRAVMTIDVGCQTNATIVVEGQADLRT